MYNSPKPEQKPVAALSGGQAVTVIDSDAPNVWQDAPAWFKVKTWLGDKWLKAEADAYYTGTLTKTDRVVTTLMKAELYDHPGMAPSAHSISPQRVQVKATFDNSPAAPANATSLMMSQDKWYQIDTWIGLKWIRNPALLEDVNAEATAYKVKLLEPATVYPVPFIDASRAESLQPQVADVTGEWVAGFGPSETTWLRLALPQGERWMALNEQVLTNYRTIDETIKLQTETRYFDNHPGSTMPLESGWLAPGEYEAFEVSGDEWVLVP